MVSNLDSDPCHSRAQDSALPAWILWRESPRIDDLDNAELDGDNEGREVAVVLHVRDLDLLLDEDVMQCEELILLLHTFINVRTPALRSLDAGGENLPCPLTQANSSLNSWNAFIDENEVGEAVNKLKEIENDITENELNDDVDIPWSIEQSDREGDDQRSDEVESQIAIDIRYDWDLVRKVF